MDTVDADHSAVHSRGGTNTVNPRGNTSMTTVASSRVAIELVRDRFTRLDRHMRRLGRNTIVHRSCGEKHRRQDTLKPAQHEPV